MHNFDDHSYDDHSYDDSGHDNHSFKSFDGAGFEEANLSDEHRGDEVYDYDDQGVLGYRHNSSEDAVGLKGYLLAISPYFEDDQFEQAVILIVQHDEAGAVGLVLNQPADSGVSHMWDDVCDTSTSESIRFGIGGPLSGPVVALHTSQAMGEELLADGLYLSAHAKRLKKLSNQSQIPCRMVIGHTEWEPGALEDEVANGLWMPIPATAEAVFGEDEYLWQDAIRMVGDNVILAAPGVHELADPLMN